MNRTLGSHGTVVETPRKRYTIKVEEEERLFLEREMNRLVQERFARSRRFERVSFGETLRELLNELRTYRETCTCLASEQAQDLAENTTNAERLDD